VTLETTTSGMVRSNLVVAVGTALSRVTGLGRVAIFAIVIGQTAVADAYNSANGSPNAIYELLLGGVLSASLVPMFTKHAKEDDQAATEAVVTVSIIALAIVTVIAVVTAPWIFHLFSINPPKTVNPAIYREVGTTLARVFLLQIFFYGLSALGTALLQARRRFFAAAWAPVLANLVIIISLLFVNRAISTPTVELTDVLVNDQLRYMLWFGATVGIAVMALALLPALQAAEIKLNLTPDFKHPAVRQLLRLSGWTLGYVIANQVAAVVVQNLALSSGPGRQDAYLKAFTFFVLPHGLLGVTIATTFVPEMVRMVLQKDKKKFIDRSSLGIRMVALLTIPAGFGLFVLRRPLIGAMLQHRKFTGADALITSRALGGFALGLVGFSVYLFVLRCFYAHQDARTPFVINLFENLFNVVLAWVLIDRYGVLGLGVAFAVAYILSSAWAILVLSYKVPGFPLRATFSALGQMVLAGVVMAEAVWMISRTVGSNVGLGALSRVIAGTLVGVVIYPGVLYLLGAPEVRVLQRRIRVRKAG
jgi:putative peptidoglycan lipid II flippase